LPGYQAITRSVNYFKKWGGRDFAHEIIAVVEQQKVVIKIEWDKEKKTRISVMID